MATPIGFGVAYYTTADDGQLKPLQGSFSAVAHRRRAERVWRKIVAHSMLRAGPYCRVPFRPTVSLSGRLGPRGDRGLCAPQFMHH